MRRWGLEKFIIWKVDNRSERMGVIHDDDVIKVNRKTLKRENLTSQMLERFSRYRAAWKPAEDFFCLSNKSPLYHLSAPTRLRYPTSSYQLLRVRGSNPASVIKFSISSQVIRNVVPALLTTFSSIITEPKSFAPYRKAIWPILGP
jgi:hypothetical protein